MFVFFGEMDDRISRIEPVPPTPPNAILKSIERARPKGSHQDVHNRSWSMDAEDCKRNLFRRQSSLSPSDLPSIQEIKSTNPFVQISKKIVVRLDVFDEFFFFCSYRRC